MSVRYVDRVKLIRSVRERRLIWDHKCEEYLDKELMSRAWNDVAAELGVPVQECRKKWRNLRDVYMKEVKKQDSGKRSRWRYVTLMGFLDQVKAQSQPAPDTVDDIKMEEIPGPDATDATNADGHIDLQVFASKEDAESNASFSQAPAQACQVQGDFDQDYHFLMSLLPSMRALPQRRKNLVRAKVLQILCEENV